MAARSVFSLGLGGTPTSERRYPKRISPLIAYLIYRNVPITLVIFLIQSPQLQSEQRASSKEGIEEKVFSQQTPQLGLEFFNGIEFWEVWVEETVACTQHFGQQQTAAFGMKQSGTVSSCFSDLRHPLLPWTVPSSIITRLNCAFSFSLWNQSIYLLRKFFLLCLRLQKLVQSMRFD